MIDDDRTWFPSLQILAFAYAYFNKMYIFSNNYSLLKFKKSSSPILKYVKDVNKQILFSSLLKQIFL